MRRRSVLVKVLAPVVAAALFGSAVLIGGCGDDDAAAAPVYTGGFEGTITYGGAGTGTHSLMVYAYRGGIGGAEAGSSGYSVTETDFVGGFPYSVTGLPDGSYAIIAWWDLDGGGGPTPGDALALNHLVQVTNGVATTGIDFLLLDGGPAYHITVNVDGGGDDVISGFGNFGSYYPSGMTDPFPVDPDTTLMLASNPSEPPWAMITFDGDTTGAFDVTSAEAFVSYEASGNMAYGTYAVPSGTVTVATYGLVNQLIVGTFDVMANEFDIAGPTGNTANLTGSFSVVRAMDDLGFGP